MNESTETMTDAQKWDDAEPDAQEPNTIAVYYRVSTSDQNLQRQAKRTIPYAENRVGGDAGSFTAGDVASYLEEQDAGGGSLEIGSVTVFHDKSTGTDTDRAGYREMIDAIERGAFDALVVDDTTRLSRSLQDIDRIVDRVVEHGAEVHFVRDNLPPFTGGDDPMDRLMLQILGAFAEWEARTKRQNTREGIQARRESDEDYHHGRAPLGFEKEDGHLYRTELYHDVVATLDDVLKGELSKRKAADELNTSRTTIRRALDRREMYGL